WKPMHLQPVFAGCQVLGGDVAAALFQHGLCLPSGAAMSEADLARVVEVVRLLHSTHPPTWPLTHPPPRATPPAQPTSPLRSAPDL
ncbi:MAG: hypothetical protein WBE17_17020, partial [Anaerolineae bacterium]